MKVMQHSRESESIAGSTAASAACYATRIEMPTPRSTETRTEKHRKAHKLVQTWVSPELWNALVARAKSEGRTLANFARRELGKLVGIAE